MNNFGPTINHHPLQSLARIGNFEYVHESYQITLVDLFLLISYSTSGSTSLYGQSISIKAIDENF